MFDLVDGLVGFDGDLFEVHPDQDGTSDMIADGAGFAALATLQAGELLGFAMKLLNFPAQATRLLCGLRVILSQVVGDDVVRALRRQHHPEQLHLMFFGKALDLNPLTLCALRWRPRQRVYSPVGRRTTSVIHLPIIFEWAVVK